MKRRFFICSIFLLGTSSMGVAAPQGFKGVAGNPRIQQSGHVTNVHAGNKAIIHWKEFSIGKSEKVQFFQDNAKSMVLNRVTGGNPSHILGKLEANGKVILINPKGIFCDKGASIRVGDFITSTLDILDKSFIEGSELLFQGDSPYEVKNLGRIEALNGNVTLIARYVKDQGELVAKNGKVVIGAGRKVLLQLDGGNIFIFPSDKLGEKKEGVGIDLGGSITARSFDFQADGNAYALAIKDCSKKDATNLIHKNGRNLLVAKEGNIEFRGELFTDHQETKIVAEEVALDGKVEGYRAPLHITTERLSLNGGEGPALLSLTESDLTVDPFPGKNLDIFVQGGQKKGSSSRVKLLNGSFFVDREGNGEAVTLRLQGGLGEDSFAGISIMGRGTLCLPEGATLSLLGKGEKSFAKIEIEEGDFFLKGKDLILKGDMASSYIGLKKGNIDLSLNQLSLEAGEGVSAYSTIFSREGKLTVHTDDLLSLKSSESESASLSGKGVKITGKGDISLQDSPSGAKGSYIVNQGEGSIGLTIETESSFFSDGASLLQNHGGDLTLITGDDLTVGRVQNVGEGATTFVVDQSSIGAGPGRFIMQKEGLIEGNGPIRLFTSSRSQNEIPGVINTVLFRPGKEGIPSMHEKWGTRYPNLFEGGGGFTIFYKEWSFAFPGALNIIRLTAGANAQMTDTILPYYGRYFLGPVHFTVEDLDQEKRDFSIDKPTHFKRTIFPDRE